MVLAGVTLYGTTASIPLFLESLVGYTALQSGYAMIPRGLGALIAMPLAGRLVGKVPGRYLVAGGFLMFGASSLALAHLSLDLSPWDLFWPLFFSGFSIGFIFVPLNTIALGGLKAEQLGNATGIFNLMRNMGGSAGISLVTTFVARSAQLHQNVLVAHLTPYDPAYTSRLNAMAAGFAAHGDAVTAQHQALAALYQTVVTQANLLAFLDNFRWFALLGAGCVAAAFLLRRSKASGPIASH
jgi:MFS transporter, DHA2 family, multidrug resistance protein